MKEAENELSFSFSTYGLITAERILERYRIILPREELANILRKTNSFYHALLKIPLKNVFNGIILQQVNDYEIYAQKLFIDYLMSGQTSKGEGPGSGTRSDLEHERKILVNLSEEFHDCEQEHNGYIADSQKSQIEYAGQWLKALDISIKKIKKAIAGDSKHSQIANAINLVVADMEAGSRAALNKDHWISIEHNLSVNLTPEAKDVITREIHTLLQLFDSFEESSEDMYANVMNMGTRLREWRKEFYYFILKVKELLAKLPDYQIDEAQMQENLESLYFDMDIGEERA